MLNRSQVFEIIRDKFWIFKFIDGNGLAGNIFLGENGNGYGFLVIAFEEDGTVKFPSRVGFEPGEFKKWDFDQEKQEIVFLDDGGNSTKRATLPESGEYHTELIKLINDDRFFENYPYTSVLEEKNRIIGGENMIFMPYHFSANLGNVRHLGRIGFSVHPVRDLQTLVATYNEIYDYMADKPYLENIIMGAKEVNAISMPTQKEIGIFQDKNGDFNFDYLSGNRSSIMEFINVVLIEANNFMIKNLGQRVNEYELLHRVLTEKFEGRYEVL